MVASDSDSVSVSAGESRLVSSAGEKLELCRQVKQVLCDFSAGQPGQFNSSLNSTQRAERMDSRAESQHELRKFESIFFPSSPLELVGKQQNEERRTKKHTKGWQNLFHKPTRQS